MSEGYTLHSGGSLPEPGILIRDRNLKNPQVAFWRPNEKEKSTDANF